jgi:hypothetical protein
MFMILAKRNLKATCAKLWKPFSRHVHEEVRLSPSDFFSPALSRDGDVRLITLMTGVWHDILTEALDLREAAFLEHLEQHAWLIASYVSIVPHRAWTPVLMWLDERLDRSWYHAGHRPN